MSMPSARISSSSLGLEGMVMAFSAPAYTVSNASRRSISNTLP